MKRVLVRSLVRELGAYIPHGKTPKHKKTKNVVANGIKIKTKKVLLKFLNEVILFVHLSDHLHIFFHDFIFQDKVSKNFIF